MNYVHKQVTKVKIQITASKMLEKGWHGQNAESQAGTSKSKRTNTKLVTPSLT